MTVDHLIVKATEKEKYRRYKITLKNAEKMMEKWSSKGYSFELVGVAQGWNPDSYYNAIKELIDMNFKYIAIGGLVRSTTREIIKIIKRCYSLWERKSIRVHIFGVGRDSIIPFYLKYKIYSFDAAYHRRSWLASKENT